MKQAKQGNPVFHTFALHFSAFPLSHVGVCVCALSSLPIIDISDKPVTVRFPFGLAGFYLPPTKICFPWLVVHFSYTGCLCFNLASASAWHCPLNIIPSVRVGLGGESLCSTFFKWQYCLAPTEHSYLSPHQMQSLPGHFVCVCASHAKCKWFAGTSLPFLFTWSQAIVPRCRGRVVLMQRHTVGGFFVLTLVTKDANVLFVF